VTPVLDTDYVEEDARLRDHFEWVLLLLRAQEPKSGGPRESMLDELEGYLARGAFPRNTLAKGLRSPIFVDDSGTNCAVAHLLGATGATALVEWIRVAMNTARIDDMPIPRLEAWCLEHGLRRCELALIQPSYDCEDNQECQDVRYSPGPGCVATPKPDGTECLDEEGTCQDGHCVLDPDDGCTVADGRGDFATLLALLFLIRLARSRMRG